MACFVVPAAVGVMTVALGKRFPKRWHVNWLNAMIFGGTAALAVEHAAHGEIVPWPPFLTAVGSQAGTAAMLGEMAAVGIPMLLALVLAWVVMVVAYERVMAGFCEKAVAAVGAGAARLKTRRLDLLALMLWGTLIMVLVDQAMAFIGGNGAVAGTAAGGLAAGWLVLGILMAMPLLAIWAIAAFTPLGARICTG